MQKNKLGKNFLTDSIFKKVVAVENEIEEVLNILINLSNEINDDPENIQELKDEYIVYGKKMLELEKHLNLLKGSKHYGGDIKDRTFME